MTVGYIYIYAHKYIYILHWFFLKSTNTETIHPSHYLEPKKKKKIHRVRLAKLPRKGKKNNLKVKITLDGDKLIRHFIFMNN